MCINKEDWETKKKKKKKKLKIFFYFYKKRVICLCLYLHEEPLATQKMQNKAKTKLK